MEDNNSNIASASYVLDQQTTVELEDVLSPVLMKMNNADIAEDEKEIGYEDIIKVYDGESEEDEDFPETVESDFAVGRRKKICSYCRKSCSSVTHNFISHSVAPVTSTGTSRPCTKSSSIQ